MTYSEDFFKKLAEEHSAVSSALLRMALDHVRECVFILAVHDDQPLLWGNGNVKAMFGYKAAELVGQSASTLHMDEAQFATFRRRSMPPVMQDKPYRGRAWMRRKEGSCFPAEHMITPFCPVSDQQVAIWFVRDLSDVSSAAMQEGIQHLTQREREVFTCIAQGRSAKETARLLGISPRTVELHRARILSKCKVASTTQLLSQLLLAASRVRDDYDTEGL